MKKSIIVLGSLLMLAGCDKSPKDANTTSANLAQTGSVTTPAAATLASQVAPTTNVVPSSTQHPAARALVDQTMSVMTSAFGMANEMSQKSLGKPKFTPEHIECFSTYGNDFATQKFNEYLTTKFSVDEIKTLDTYFASPTGIKQVAMTKQMLAGMMGDKSANLQSAMPSETEQAEMAKFSESPLGQKYEQALKDKEALKPYFAPVVEQKVEHCKLPK